MKSSRNREITLLSITDIGKPCPSREILTSLVCLLTLFAKIIFSRKFPDSQYQNSIKNPYQCFIYAMILCKKFWWVEMRRLKVCKVHHTWVKSITLSRMIPVSLTSVSSTQRSWLEESHQPHCQLRCQQFYQCHLYHLSFHMDIRLRLKIKKINRPLPSCPQRVTVT